MQTETSLPLSEQPATGPYPELSEINPHPPTLFPLRYILILSFHLSLGHPSGLFPSGVPIIIFKAFLISPMRATYPSISYFLIWSS
jgi:hypothetical protein